MRYFAHAAIRAELDAYRISHLPPTTQRLLRIVWDGLLCLLLTGGIPLRLAKLTECAFQHLLIKIQFDRRDTSVNLTAFSVNFLVYDLSPGQVLRMEGLFAYNPFNDELQFPTCFEEVLIKLSKGCCFGMSISYILHRLNGSTMFINSAAYGVPALAQQIQLFCGFPVVGTIFSTNMKFLAAERLNSLLKKLCLRAGRIEGRVKISSFNGFTVGEGTHLIIWTEEDVNASGHASVLVIEKDEVTLYEPNIGELRGPRKSLVDIFRFVPTSIAHFEYFSLCTICKTETNGHRAIHDVLRFGYISKSYVVKS